LKKIAVIGSGFAGLTSASLLASKGFEVHLYEKNDSFGGRARQFKEAGYTFDMGPSWYWMPEVFEDYFALFGKKSSDFYTLKRLDPSYTIYYENGEKIDVPANYQELKEVFERIESGSSRFLDKFLEEAEYKYKVGMEEFVWKPGHSILEFADIRVLKSMFRLQMLSSISSQIRKNIKSDQLRQLLEFPVLFLGATPQKTPALYSLMNYADLKLGTWYPMGGMHKIIEAMVSICEENGVQMYAGHPVDRIDNTPDGKVSIRTKKGVEIMDYVIASADYHHVDQDLLPKGKRNYTPDYWDKRAMAPSSLLFYLGIDHKVKNIHHHNLFFDADFDLHAKEIYTDPKWPEKPLFYVCCPSKTDDSVAPEGKENMFILIPVAPGLKDDPSQHQIYLERVLKRMEPIVGENLLPHIEYQRNFSVDDFKRDYNAFKGNAYGLANTLEQTAFLKPKLKSKHIKNMYFTGQLTTPGPGMPPSIISGQVVANEIMKQKI
jgi:phytoene desaturase